MTVLISVGAVLIVALLMWAIIAVPKNEADQRQEDDAQEDCCGRVRERHEENKR